MVNNNRDRIIVGISGYHLTSEENRAGLVKGVPGQEFSLFSYDLVWSVMQAGGLPSPLPIVSERMIADQLDLVDALIFAGGEDVHPKYYTQHIEDYPEASLLRDQYELLLLEQALQRDIPILFICRGLQLLNVYLGGTLYVDIGEEGATCHNHWVTKEREKPVHLVQVNKDSFASQVLGGEEIEVNSVHHQAIKQLAPGLKVVGRANDGLIEVVTMEERDGVLGVQWHPEMMARYDSNSLQPFRWLIQQATQVKTRN